MLKLFSTILGEHVNLHSAILFSDLTLKRPPGVKFDPSFRFFFVNFFYVSFSDTILCDFVMTSVL